MKKMKKKMIKKIINEVVLTFCENLAELGCPKDEPDADMWFRYLSPKDQLKVSKKIMKIIKENNYENT